MSRRAPTVLSIGVLLALLLALGVHAFVPADSTAPARPAAERSMAVNASLGRNAPTLVDPAAVARSDAGAIPAATRLLRIVDGTGAPVAGAEVAFDLSADLLEHWQPFAFDAEARLAAAARHRSAQDGVVALPIETAVAFVIARAGERFGQGKVEFDDCLDAMPEIVIAPDRTLRIAVVSARGEPRPNVPVEVTFQDEQALAGPGTSTHRLPRTDANGIANLWHAQTLPFWDRSTASVELRALVLGATRQAVRVALADPIPEPIPLECPDHGSVRVRAWIADGVPNRLEALPTINEAVEAPEWCDPVAMPGATPAEWCMFPLALGRRWLVTGAALGSLTVPGPTRQAEEVAVDLMASRADSFTLLLLQPDGEPCASQPIEFDSRTAETDAQGRIAFVARVTDELPVLFRAPQLHAHATVVIPAPATRAGPLHLGTVRLQSLRALATGRVVDGTTARPLRAFVQAFGNRRDVDGREDVRAACGIDGAFELWGESTGSIRIHAETQGYVSTEVEIAVGARDVVVAMHRARLLRATVLVDPEIAIEDLDVRVCRGDGTTTWQQARIEGGRFHALFTLPEGDDLALAIAGRDELPPLRLVPAAMWTQQDGVFATTVDLRGQLANVFAAVRFPETQARPGGSIYVRAVGSAARWASLDLAPRMVFAAARDAAFDAIVRPDGGACMRLVLRPGENTIDVLPAGVAKIDIVGMPASLAKTIGVQVWRLVRREPLLDELAASGHSIAPGEVQTWPRTVANLEQLTGAEGWEVWGAGAVEFRLERRGSYIAVPHVVVKERRIPLLDAAVAIEITTPGETVPATIRLDPEKVRAALQ